MNTLPLDLLRMILEYIPPWPRVLVVSLVSRRWRTEVLRSITFLPDSFLSSPALPGKLRLFPSLTRAYVHSKPTEANRPTPEPSCTCRALLPLTSLRTILIEFCHAQSQCSCAMTLVRNNATTLETLDIFSKGRGRMKRASPYARSINDLHNALLNGEVTFPRLRSLILDCALISPPMLLLYSALLTVYSSQLTHLSLHNRVHHFLEWYPIQEVQFPQLTSCYIEPSFALPLITNAPNMKHLALSTYPRTTLPLLPPSVFTDRPTLTVTRLALHLGATTDFYLPYATSLTSLTLFPSGSVAEVQQELNSALPQCARLQILTIDTPKPPLWSFRSSHVRTLLYTIDERCQPGELIGFIENTLITFTSLVDLDLTCICKLSRDELRSILVMLTKAGVGVFILNNEDNDFSLLDEGRDFPWLCFLMH